MLIMPFNLIFFVYFCIIYQFLRMRAAVEIKTQCLSAGELRPNCSDLLKDLCMAVTASFRLLAVSSFPVS